MDLFEINRWHTHGALNQAAIDKHLARLIARHQAEVKG
jgi:hypothetical protein